MLLVFDFQLFTQGFPYGFIAIVRNAHVEGEDIAAKIPVAQSVGIIEDVIEGILHGCG